MIDLFKKYIPYRFKITLITFLGFILFFSIWRLIFLYFHIDKFSENYLLYLKSFYIGYRLDAVVASILTLPIFIISYIPYLKFNKYVRLIYLVYTSIIYLVIGFMSVIDIEFFREIGFRLNYQAQMYGFDAGNEAWIQIWVAYPIFHYLFIILFIVYLIYSINNILLPKSGDNNHFYIELLSFAILFIFLGASSRGGFQERPVTPGHAYFSNTDMMANHLAINSTHNYIHSIMQSINETNLNFYNDADNITSMIIKKNQEKNIEIGNLNSNPNIVLLILESHVANRCNFLNPNLKDTITPFLDSISKESINFRNCYANGTRSAYGLSSIYCSWPVIPGYPLNRQQQYKIKGQTTFASILKDIGYETIFMYGGDSEFDEMKSFSKINAFDRIHDYVEDEYLKKFKLDNTNEGVNPWGVFDEFLLDRCITILNTKNKETPVFISLFTTTNHLPWIIPEKERNKTTKSINKDFNHSEPFSPSKITMRYVDNKLKEFFNKAKKQKWFNNTIFIITADHGLNIFNDNINDPKNGHIPLLFYNTKLNPTKIDKIVSQIDILPTTLDLINRDNYSSNLFGASGFKGGGGYVFRNNDYNIQWIENGWVYSEIIGLDFHEYYPLLMFGESNQKPLTQKNKDILKKRCRAYAQSAFYKQKLKLKGN